MARSDLSEPRFGRTIVVVPPVRDWKNKGFDVAVADFLGDLHIRLDRLHRGIVPRPEVTCDGRRIVREPRELGHYDTAVGFEEAPAVAQTRSEAHDVNRALGPDKFE